jgi:hypothetical protein
MKNMNNFTSYAFLILTYSLNNLDHWFKLNRDKILYLIRQNLLLKKNFLNFTMHGGAPHILKFAAGPHTKTSLYPSSPSQLGRRPST